MALFQHRRKVWLFIGLCLSYPAVAWPAPSFIAFVSIQAQAAFVQAVGGNHVQVEIMVPAGRTHETYEPTPRQLMAITQARIYFRIGLPFEEAFMGKIQANNPALTIVDTRKNVLMLQMVKEEDPREAAATGGKDPHIWLDPNRVKIQAKTIHDALVVADPLRQADYDRNLNEFTARLSALDRELRQILSHAPSKRFMVYHPSWGYFAQAYGLVQIPIEIEGKEPGPRSLARLIDTARRLGVKTIFVQKQASDRNAKMVAGSIGGRVVAVDDLPLDYFGALRYMAQQIVAQK